MGGYHSGFTMAGIGMVFGLVIYLLGQPLIREIDTNDKAAATGTATEESGGDPPARYCKKRKR